MTLTGDLPIRASVSKLPGYKKFVGQVPGHRRVGRQPQQRHPGPARRAPSTRRSPRAIGQAVQSVLLGKASPKDALSQAAQQVNGILAAPG